MNFLKLVLVLMPLFSNTSFADIKPTIGLCTIFNPTLKAEDRQIRIQNESSVLALEAGMFATLIQIRKGEDIRISWHAGRLNLFVGDALSNTTKGEMNSAFPVAKVKAADEIFWAARSMLVYTAELNYISSDGYTHRISCSVTPVVDVTGCQKDTLCFAL